MKIKCNYGWRPDIPDQRDYLYKAIKLVVKLPKRVDLREHCSAIERQGNLGSCTAQALAGNLEFLDNKIDHTYTDLSRLFIYYNERVLMGSVDYDSGASLRDGIKTLKKEGACEEDMWPYVIKKFDDKPPAECYEAALERRIESYHRINSLGEMRACLAEGYPFVFGFTAYESFDTDRVKKTGIVNMPGNNEVAIGGHAVMAAGYDDKSARFIVRNSWGSGWGAGGYCTMPYDYLEKLGGDFWTIRK